MKPLYLNNIWVPMIGWVPTDDKYSEKLKCGNVNVNDMSCYWETHIPAGGASGTSSGYGRQGGRHTIQEMSDLKTITMDIEWN